MAKKIRIDSLLVARGFFESRESAQRAIMAGEVRVGDRVIDKSSELVEAKAEIAVAELPRYAGRGALKLEGALDFFQVDVGGKIALDIGASTGGFTDCLLQRGAAKVYAVDVGHGQLAWKIRNEPRVVVMEKLNARFLSREHIPEFVDLCVIDVSFISLTLILPRAFELITPDGVIIALIKPQFEAGKAEADRGAGVIRDAAIHQRVLRELKEFVASLPRLRWCKVTESPAPGPAGNKEFLVLIEYVG